MKPVAYREATIQLYPAFGLLQGKLKLAWTLLLLMQLFGELRSALHEASGSQSIGPAIRFGALPALLEASVAPRCRAHNMSNPEIAVLAARKGSSRLILLFS